jgi:hypothetical protein
VSPPSSGPRGKRSKKPIEAGSKLGPVGLSPRHATLQPRALFPLQLS